MPCLDYARVNKCLLISVVCAVGKLCGDPVGKLETVDLGLGSWVEDSLLLRTPTFSHPNVYPQGLFLLVEEAQEFSDLYSCTLMTPN